MYVYLNLVTWLFANCTEVKFFIKEVNYIDQKGYFMSKGMLLWGIMDVEKKMLQLSKDNN